MAKCVAFAPVLLLLAENDTRSIHLAAIARHLLLFPSFNHLLLNVRLNDIYNPSNLKQD
jgi:hypothetical protein